ncbi:zinc fingers and homeoboxes protein 3 [Gouania willdenowi]|uniref:Zinc fingers and homeoboxes protein 3-like n=1 Tax=Gouania willdenowi TaxID=441366 RepID=A0A8C5E9D5_GOUWI|nr:zinc fingers and homeoboxes protein 3-like [Gouania willdenowi]XP_028309491.1 zinc fingers and homeoboxes protein 3-like [Gouania willdenowi]
MASKRKSTTPCMIPSKIIHPSEELHFDSVVVPCQFKSSGALRHSPLDTAESSKPEAGKAVKDSAGTYTCKPCNFETLDLNLFLDHVYSGHPSFRADPSFFCVSCGVSAPKFEGLALHNARIHPSTLNATLHLRNRIKRMVVEQNLDPEADLGKDNEISITKTPIMRMLKSKSESKRIVVSHPVSDESSADLKSAAASKDSEKKETSATTATHVPTIVHNGTAKVSLPSAIQIVNGSGTLPIIKTPITQVVSVVHNSILQNSAPVTVTSNASSSSSKNLPKVMIPLSSIPTYCASMDSSSFLKTSFSKFPYPTKAELCYLTVVTKFPEEQIKIWFTAQRLMQGISWSPEEIEEARRKMFNTIIQTSPANSQNQTRALTNATQHTITVLPASLGATGIPHILQGSLVSQGGVIVTQPVVANGIQVSSAPVALAVTPKPQAAARPMMQARPTAALVADKGVSMMGGAVGSSSSAGNIIISSSSSSKGGGGQTGNVIGSSQASVINLSVRSSNHSHSKASSVNGKHSSTTTTPSNKSNSPSQVNGKPTGVSSKVKKPSIAQSNSKQPTGNKQRSKESSGSGDKKPTTSTSVDDVGFSSRDLPPINIEEGSSPASKSSSPSPAATQSSSSTSQSSLSTFLDASFYKGKKSPGQLNALKDSFQANQFPGQEEVDRLITLTGLTMREVRKWFSDRRYNFRNLKGARSSTGGQNKPSAATGTSTPCGGTAHPIDLSDNSRAKTPQHNSDTLSPSATQTPTSPTTPSRRLPRAPSPDFTAIRYKEREPHQVKALETSFDENPDPSAEEVDRLRSETKMTRREINGWFTERRKKVAAEKKKEEAERAMREEEEEEQEEMEVDGDDKLKDDSSGEQKVNPIKINLKMLKVTEANGKAEAEGLDASAVAPQPISTPASSPGNTPKVSQCPTPKPSNSPKPTAARAKKTAEQLHQLKLIYARTQWPSAAQYDELITATGLPRPEVVRWFGDSRYVQKNGLLKWLDAYQSMAADEDLQKGGAKILQAHFDAHGRLEQSKLQELVQSSGLTADAVKRWFSSKVTLLPRLEQTAAADGGDGGTSTKPEPIVQSSPMETLPTEKSVTHPVSSDGSEEGPTNTDQTTTKETE